MKRLIATVLICSLFNVSVSANIAGVPGGGSVSDVERDIGWVEERLDGFLADRGVSLLDGTGRRAALSDLVSPEGLSARGILGSDGGSEGLGIAVRLARVDGDSAELALGFYDGDFSRRLSIGSFTLDAQQDPVDAWAGFQETIGRMALRAEGFGIIRDSPLVESEKFILAGAVAALVFLVFLLAFEKSPHTAQGNLRHARAAFGALTVASGLTALVLFFFGLATAAKDAWEISR